MDFKFINKESFDIIGKAIDVSTKNGENISAVPNYWSKCNADGTTAALCKLKPGANLLGVVTDFSHETESFTYFVAVESEGNIIPSGMTRYTVPACTWAVFTSVGPLPQTIQDLEIKIFQEWLHPSEYMHADAPDLEVYFEGDTTSNDYTCEVWIPVVKK